MGPPVGNRTGVTRIKITVIIMAHIHILYTHEDINPAPVVHGIAAYLSLLTMIPRYGWPPPIDTPGAVAFPSMHRYGMAPHRCPGCGCPPIDAPIRNGPPSMPSGAVDLPSMHRYGMAPHREGAVDLPSMHRYGMAPHRCPPGAVTLPLMHRYGMVPHRDPRYGWAPIEAYDMDTTSCCYSHYRGEALHII